jgi:hypothetical protein
MNEAFEKWAEGRYRSAIEEQDIKSEAEQAFLAGRLQGIAESEAELATLKGLAEGMALDLDAMRFLAYGRFSGDAPRSLTTYRAKYPKKEPT